MKKAAAAASFWASRIGRLSKSASGLSTVGTKQLYNTVAVPRFTYGVEVWYSLIYKPQGTQKSRGSVSVNNKLRTAQRKVATAITGGLRTTAGDVLDVHAYILPIDLLMNKLLYRAALHLCSLPKSHPLHTQIRSVHSTEPNVTFLPSTPSFALPILTPKRSRPSHQSEGARVTRPPSA